MIYKEITDEYYFWNWLKHSDSYSNSFSLDGAKALQAYLDEMSEEMPEGRIEFDPIAWCVEFSEYDSLQEAFDVYGDPDDVLPGDKYTDKQALEYFQDRTTVIELDNGHIILGEF